MGEVWRKIPLWLITLRGFGSNRETTGGDVQLRPVRWLGQIERGKAFRLLKWAVELLRPR